MVDRRDSLRSKSRVPFLTTLAEVSPTRPAAALAQSVILAWGWRRRVVALLAGASGAAALPPYALVPVVAIALSVAVWLIDGAQDRGEDRPAWGSLRAAFGAGWWWGFGYFVAGLWWVGAAFMVEPDKFAWAAPFGVLGLPLALAFFPAFGFALARLLWSPGPMRIFALSLGLGVSEWLRGLLFTGFPWNDIGMSLGDNLVLAQIASVVGLHGLTFIAIAIFAAPATLWSLDDGRLRLGPTAWAALALALIAGVGLYRLDTPASPTVPGVKLRIMQPNVSQGSDFSPENKEALLERYFALSDRATAPDRTGVADVTHLIWPESAFPFILSRDADALAEITEFLRGGAVLITGAARMEEGPDRRARYFNSIEVLNRNGLSSERYDKRHLVPFGEYLPFASLFERARITQFVDIPGGFDAGVGRAVLRVPGLPTALPLVCYEAIFPSEIGAVFSSSPRADWMLNVTDDAWFGSTPGPYQHFAQARLRSIEKGLPMVRAANSGVSAVIDGYGRILVSAPLGVEGVLDGSLPKPLAPTWQYRWGSLSALAIAIVFLSFSLVGRRRR
jgi:apolipoprotein N-acyltransferase